MIVTAEDLAACDTLWLRRHDPARLAELTEILDKAQGPGVDYPVLWRVARLDYFVGLQHAANGSIEAAGLFTRGAALGLRASQLEGLEVEGHFWFAANALQTYRSHGAIGALRMLGTITKHIERATRIDEAYSFAGPLRVWGKLTHLRPLLLNGSLDQALDIHRRALQIAPHNSTNLLYYAETLLADQQWPRARQTLQQIIDAPPDEAWQWEQRHDRSVAEGLLAELNQGR